MTNQLRNPDGANASRSFRRVWPALAGVLVFGVMMGLRPEFSSIWARAGVAACACMILVLGIQASRKRHKD